MTKLVRDFIPRIIESKGEACVHHVAEDVEYWGRLKEKLMEEVGEFLEAESVEEMADVFEVIEAILKFKNIEREEVERVRVSKKEERGGFEGRVVLDEY